jgi:DNA-binding NarL/FixJ family response regulator
VRRPTADAATAVVVDGQPMMRNGIVDALTRGGFDVVAHGAAPADIALPMARSPAAILVGWDATGRRDLEGLRRLADAEPASKVVVLAPTPTPDDARRAFAAGACAVILKTVDPDDLPALIRQVVQESIIVAPRHDVAAATATGLTPREVQVLSRVAAGASNATVAAQLWLSEPTVKFHLRNIYRKLDVNGRTEASRLALERGLIPRSPAL